MSSALSANSWKSDSSGSSSASRPSFNLWINPAQRLGGSSVSCVPGCSPGSHPPPSAAPCRDEDPGQPNVARMLWGSVSGPEATPPPDADPRGHRPPPLRCTPRDSGSTIARGTLHSLWSTALHLLFLGHRPRGWFRHLNRRISRPQRAARTIDQNHPYLADLYFLCIAWHPFPWDAQRGRQERFPRR